MSVSDCYRYPRGHRLHSPVSFSNPWISLRGEATQVPGPIPVQHASARTQTYRTHHSGYQPHRPAVSSISDPLSLRRQLRSGARARVAKRELPRDRRRFIWPLGFALDLGTRLTSGSKGCCGTRAGPVSTYACFRFVTTIMSLERIVLVVHVVVSRSLCF